MDWTYLTKTTDPWWVLVTQNLWIS